MKYCENAVEITGGGGKMSRKTEIILEGLQEPMWVLNPDPTDPKNQEILHLQDKGARLQKENEKLRDEYNKMCERLNKLQTENMKLEEQSERLKGKNDRLIGKVLELEEVIAHLTLDKVLLESKVNEREGGR